MYRVGYSLESGSTECCTGWIDCRSARRLSMDVGASEARCTAMGARCNTMVGTFSRCRIFCRTLSTTDERVRVIALLVDTASTVSVDMVDDECGCMASESALHSGSP